MSEEGEYGDWRARLERRDIELRRPDPAKEGVIGELGLMFGVSWATWLAERGIRPMEIPGTFWSLDATESGLQVAIVACPCGHEPRVLQDAAPAACGTGGCQRFFFFSGSRVYVYNSPALDRPAPEDEPEQIPPDGVAA